MKDNRAVPIVQADQHQQNITVLMPTRRTNKDHAHRIRLYCDWLAANKLPWYHPDIEAYRDYLLNEYITRDEEHLRPSSIKAHLSTIRGRYRDILRKNITRDFLYRLTSEKDDPSDRKAFVDEMVLRIENAISPEHSKVDSVFQQDRPDADFIRLTSRQVTALLHAPGQNSLKELRDTALIALMLCTGIREAELCALEVRDLRQSLNNQPALHVRRGKGRKERLIPYGELIWVLDIVDRWLENAGIEEGPVFRGLYKGSKRVRESRLSVRTVNKILERYPIEIDGKQRVVKPHDLRRTYARRLYDAGVDLLAIRDNLGHADSRTTLKYIGAMDVDARKPPAIYDIDLPYLDEE